MRNKTKSYFAVDNAILMLYQNRTILATDVCVYSYLCSRRKNGLFNGVRVSQEKIAFYCGLTRKTVAASIDRLMACGLITAVIHNIKKARKKYETSIYALKPLPKSGFILIPRFIFRFPIKSIAQNTVTTKMFAIFVLMCKAQSFEYEKSWNSYSDICEKLGFSENQRSEIIKLIGRMETVGLIKKTVRRIKGVFVDNIYRIVGFVEAVIERKRKRRSGCLAATGTSFVFRADRIINSNHIIKPILSRKSLLVKPPPKKFFLQLSLFYGEGYFFRG